MNAPGTRVVALRRSQPPRTRTLRPAVPSIASRSALPILGGVLPAIPAASPLSPLSGKGQRPSSCATGARDPKAAASEAPPAPEPRSAARAFASRVGEELTHFATSRAVAVDAPVLRLDPEAPRVHVVRAPAASQPAEGATGTLQPPSRPARPAFRLPSIASGVATTTLAAPKSHPLLQLAWPAWLVFLAGVVTSRTVASLWQRLLTSFGWAPPVQSPDTSSMDEARPTPTPASSAASSRGPGGEGPEGGGEQASTSERTSSGAYASSSAQSGEFDRHDNAETVEWVNMCFRKIWRVYQRGLEQWITGLLQPVFDSLVASGSVPGLLLKLTIVELTLDHEAPTFSNMRRRTSRRDSDLPGVVDVRYTGGAKVLLMLEVGRGNIRMKVPVMVSDLDLSCALWLKIRLAPLCPWVGTVSLAFVEPPNIKVQLSSYNRVRLMRIPILQNFLRRLLTVDLPGFMVLPRRLEIDLPPALTSVAEAAVGRDSVMRAVASAVLQADALEQALRAALPLGPQTAAGGIALPESFEGELSVTLKQARNIPVWGFPWQSNPYCVLELGSQAVESRREKETSYKGSHRAPVWNQEFEFIVEDPATQQLVVHMRDSSMTGRTHVGRVTYDLSDLPRDARNGRASFGTISRWLPLQPENPAEEASGELLLDLRYEPFKDDDLETRPDAGTAAYAPATEADITDVKSAAAASAQAAVTTFSAATAIAVTKAAAARAASKASLLARQAAGTRRADSEGAGAEPPLAAEVASSGYVEDSLGELDDLMLKAMTGGRSSTPAAEVQRAVDVTTSEIVAAGEGPPPGYMDAVRGGAGSSGGSGAPGEQLLLRQALSRSVTVRNRDMSLVDLEELRDLQADMGMDTSGVEEAVVQARQAAAEGGADGDGRDVSRSMTASLDEEDEEGGAAGLGEVLVASGHFRSGDEEGSGQRMEDGASDDDSDSDGLLFDPPPRGEASSMADVSHRLMHDYDEVGSRGVGPTPEPSGDSVGRSHDLHLDEEIGMDAIPSNGSFDGGAAPAGELPYDAPSEGAASGAGDRCSMAGAGAAGQLTLGADGDVNSHIAARLRAVTAQIECEYAARGLTATSEQVELEVAAAMPEAAFRSRAGSTEGLGGLTATVDLEELGLRLPRRVDRSMTCEQFCVIKWGPDGPEPGCSTDILDGRLTVSRRGGVVLVPPLDPAAASGRQTLPTGLSESPPADSAGEVTAAGDDSEDGGGTLASVKSVAWKVLKWRPWSSSDEADAETHTPGVQSADVSSPASFASEGAERVPEEGEGGHWWDRLSLRESSATQDGDTPAESEAAGGADPEADPGATEGGPAWWAFWKRRGEEGEDSGAPAPLQPEEFNANAPLTDIKLPDNLPLEEIAKEVARVREQQDKENLAQRLENSWAVAVEQADRPYIILLCCLLLLAVAILSVVAYRLEILTEVAQNNPLLEWSPWK